MMMMIANILNAYIVLSPFFISIISLNPHNHFMC